MGGIVRGVFGKKHNTVIRGQKIGDFTITEASYGKPVPIVFGTARLNGNMIDFVDFESHEHKETHRAGKGGRRSKTTQITYTYSVAATLALCEGPIQCINKIYKDKEIYALSDFNKQYKGKIKVISNIVDKLFMQYSATVRLGTYDQKPWEYMLAKHEDRALGYNGLALVHGVWDLGDSGSMPALNFEVRGLLAKGDGGDANPYDVIVEILTNQDWGCGWDKSMLGDNQLYKDYCKAYDLGVSICLTDQRQVGEIIDDIMRATNSTQRWSQGKLYFIPLEHKAKGEYKPNLKAQYHITASDIVEGSSVVVQRKPLERKYNQRTIEFLNRDNFYQNEAVYAEDLTDININGLKTASVVKLPYITSKKQAQYIAHQMLQRDQYVRNQYKFKLGVKHGLLEPGDICYLSNDELMIDKIPIMILSKIEDTNAEYDIVAEDVMFDVNGSVAYESENASPYIVDRAIVPSDTHTLAFEPSIDYADLNGKLEVWVASAGADNWGSANVYVSFDNAHYDHIGVIAQPSIIGKVVSSDDTSATVTLVNGSILDTQKEIYLGGDFLTANHFELVGDKTYKITGLEKQYPIDSDFCVLEDLLSIPYDIEHIGDTMCIKVVAVNEFGNAQQDLSMVDVNTVYLKGHTPPDVDAVLVEQMQKVKRIIWDYQHADKSYIAGYKVRCCTGKNTWWDDGFDLMDGLVTNSPFDTSQLDNGGVYTVMVKAVSKAGIESKNPAYAVINLGDVITDNVLWTDDILSHDDLTPVNAIKYNDVWMADDLGKAFYPPEHSPMYLGDNVLFYADSWADMSLRSTFTPDTNGLLTIDGVIYGNYKIKYRERYPYTFYPEDYQKMWRDDNEQVFKIGPWSPYNGKVNVKPTTYDIEVIVYGGDYQGQIKELKAIVDVPDLMETLNDVPISSDGTRLVLKNDYLKIKVINGTIQSSEAVTMQVIDKDSNSPMVKLLDKDGKAVDGLLDVIVQGY